jgi:hypothetical protein
MGGAAANAVIKKEEVYLIMATTLSVLLDSFFVQNCVWVQENMYVEIVIVLSYRTSHVYPRTVCQFYFCLTVCYTRSSTNG